MKIHFYKYHGTGNDFVMIDNRSLKTKFSEKQIQNLCDRRFGVGADGLILLNNSKTTDFYVDYYNADASQSFCGNGARCSVAFARALGIHAETYTFDAIDGLHKAVFIADKQIEIEMLPASPIEQIGADFYLHTGSPHYVRLVENLDTIHLLEEAKKIRYNSRFKDEGVNVNFVQKKGDKLAIRTYERGVEDETYSCGTGACAVAVALAHLNQQKEGNQGIEVKGGELWIRWNSKKEPFDTLTLSGPAEKVFEGFVEI